MILHWQHALPRARRRQMLPDEPFLRGGDDPSARANRLCPCNRLDCKKATLPVPEGVSFVRSPSPRRSSGPVPPHRHLQETHLPYSWAARAKHDDGLGTASRQLHQRHIALFQGKIYIQTTTEAQYQHELHVLDAGGQQTTTLNVKTVQCIRSIPKDHGDD